MTGLIVSLAAMAVLAGVLGLRELTYLKQQREWTDERRELLNRIKPETAQVPPEGQQTPYLIEPVRSDEDYWENRGAMPYAEPLELGESPYLEEEAGA